MILAKINPWALPQFNVPNHNDNVPNIDILPLNQERVLPKSDENGTLFFRNGRNYPEISRLTTGRSPAAAAAAGGLVGYFSNDCGDRLVRWHLFQWLVGLGGRFSNDRGDWLAQWDFFRRLVGPVGIFSSYDGDWLILVGCFRWPDWPGQQAAAGQV